MSNLLSQASLVMIPSGYKEDVVYSQIPTNGNGDLSFTRASNGTRINSAGLVEVCPWNVVEYSEDFSNGNFWGASNESLTTNATTAPNGTSTADLLIPSAGTSDHYLLSGTVSNISGQVVTLSLFVKKKDNDYFYFGTGGASAFGAVVYQFSTNTFVVSGLSATATNIGNGWIRLSITGTTSATDLRLLFTPTDSTGSRIYNANGTDGTYIWGAQANIGATLKPYFPTTDRLNVPRLTYQNGGGGCPSLLLEKQSTNLAVYSEQFDNGAWPKQNLTVTANATTSPDGTQNADKLIADITNARHLIYQAFSVSANTYTFTTYAKAGENSFLIMRLDTDTPEVKTWFDLSNGTIGTSQGGLPTITAVGNGWYRCSVQYVASTSLTLYGVLYTAKTNGGENFAGNGTDGTYVWGAQIEASSYATSYIPTTSSSATRVADACYKTGISSLIGQTEGTIFLDFVVNGQSVPVANAINIYNNDFSAMTISTNSISYNDGVIRCEQFRGNGSFDNIALTSSVYAIGQRIKLAYRYKSGDFALYINGVQKSTSNSTMTFNGTKSEIYLNANTVYYAYPDSVKYNQFVQFPTALSNADLQALTTI